LELRSEAGELRAHEDVAPASNSGIIVEKPSRHPVGGGTSPRLKWSPRPSNPCYGARVLESDAAAQATATDREGLWSP